jgi:hypothetical protein
MNDFSMDDLLLVNDEGRQVEVRVIEATGRRLKVFDGKDQFYIDVDDVIANYSTDD